MKKLQIAIIAVFTIVIVFISTLGLRKASDTEDYSKYKKVYLNASWAYNYEDVSELTENCDLAAYISVTGWESNHKYKDYGVDLTVFTAEIQDSLFGKKDGTVRIVMTGKIDEKEKKIYEIADDPLMKPGDEFFVFAKANEDGTYTILSGPQGRFAIVNDAVYSLNVCDNQVKMHNSGSNININNQSKEDFYSQINAAIVERQHVTS